MKYVLLVLALTGCGVAAQPVPGRPGVYRLHYCAHEVDCFKAAEKTCPGGYDITRYGNIRPEEFTCK